MSKDKIQHELLPVLTRVARGLEVANSIAAATGNLQDQDLLEEIRITWLSGVADSVKTSVDALNSDSDATNRESPNDKTPKLEIIEMSPVETLDFAQVFMAELEQSDGKEEGPLSQVFMGKVFAAQGAIGAASLSQMNEEQNTAMSPAIQEDIFNYRNGGDDSYKALTALAKTKPASPKLS